jgi:hypothetical protein
MPAPGFVTPALAASGSTTDATSYNTASYTPTASRLAVAAIQAYMATGSAPPPQPTLTGNGLTWEFIKAQDVDTAGTDRATVWLFAALTGASPSTGALTISFGATTVGACSWIVMQSDANADVSGANAAASFVTANTVGTTTASGATVCTVTYAQTFGTDNGGFALFGNQITTGFTPRSSPAWTEGADVTTVSTCGLETQFLAGSDTAASATFAASRAGGIAVEVKAAAAAGVTRAPQVISQYAGFF